MRFEVVLRRDIPATVTDTLFTAVADALADYEDETAALCGWRLAADQGLTHTGLITTMTIDARNEESAVSLASTLFGYALQSASDLGDSVVVGTPVVRVLEGA